MKRNYEAEKVFPFLADFAEAIERYDRAKSSDPLRAATVVTSTPQDERIPGEPETAGLARPFEDVQ